MFEPRWLSPEERQAWLALISVMFKVPGTVERQLVEDDDLSLAEYLVLAMLSEAPDRSRRMSDLAAATSTGQSRLSRIVSRLERSDLIRRTVSQHDKRVVVAQLTETGRQKVEKAAPAHVAHVRHVIFDRLTPEQVRQLRDIGQALSADGDATAG